VRDNINTSKTTEDLKAVAQDMLDMGRHWSRTAQDWLRIQAGHAQQAGSTGFRSYRGVGPRGYTRPDDRIREDINESLTEADDLDASGITVAVANGVATLGGTVAQRWMKHRAEDVADGCSGVRDVRNDIQVGNPPAQ
jgi:osmotically-inducible protein OsmY